MEAWGRPKDKLHRHQEILDRYGAIANCPYKIDKPTTTQEAVRRFIDPVAKANFVTRLN